MDPRILLNPGNLFKAPMAWEMARDTPATRNVRDALKNENLMPAYVEEARNQEMGRKQGPIAEPNLEDPILNTPESQMKAFEDQLIKGETKYGSSDVGASTKADRVHINPNADEAFLYHELGHVASKQNNFGGWVRGLRDNPQTAKALQQAMMIAPLGLSALVPGDDDTALAIAASLAVTSPELLDEAFASMNGLRMMKNAGTPASFGQRSKLAGAYLSYLAAPIAAGLAGNIGGNLADDELTSALGYGQ